MDISLSPFAPESWSCETMAVDGIDENRYISSIYRVYSTIYRGKREEREKRVSKRQIKLTWMSRTSALTRDETANPFCETKFSRGNEGRKKKRIFPVQPTTSRVGSHTRLIHTLLEVLSKS